MSPNNMSDKPIVPSANAIGIPKNRIANKAIKIRAVVIF